MNGAQIKVNDLRVKYEDFEVIRGMDFAVQKGEFVSIVGKSGCGKSTLLYALADFIKKTGLVDMPAHVGVVFQNYAVFPWLKVRDNIVFGLGHLNEKEREKLLLDHLQMTGLLNEADKYPFQLSGGQGQRVALARALAPDPDVILMDEPFAALDQFTREKMQNWLLEVWEKNHKTVLFVTHNLEEALYLSDRILVIGQGKIQGEFQVPFGRPRGEQIKFDESFIRIKRNLLDLMEKQ